MWITFSLRTLLRLLLITAVLSLMLTFGPQMCHSATITIQAGQNDGRQTLRDEALQAMDVANPMTGNTTFTYGQVDGSRMTGMDGLSAYPMTDYAIVYDARAPIPEASTWVMIMMGGLLIAGKCMIRVWQVAKEADA